MNANMFLRYIFEKSKKYNKYKTSDNERDKINIKIPQSICVSF